MFSLYVNNEVIAIILDYNGIKVRLEPENVEAILDHNNFEMDHGILDTHPSNGQFFISWSPQEINIQVSKYGDGNGGSLNVNIPSTPELLRELNGVFGIWKIRAIFMKEENSTQ
jgi:hypothetical protein